MNTKIKKTFRYILRYKIDPEFNAEDRIQELLDYCKSSQTEEVMMFTTAEELSTGHPTQKELEPYVAMGKNLKTRLNEQGIDMSLNPWTTIYQISRGRKLKQNQNFNLMVGENGVVNPISVCPLCPDWQTYLCDLYCYLVGELKPTVLWVEDDWRLHNHDDYLGWGGCFCDNHLSRFSKTVGQNVSLEELLAKILAPEKAHPWRKIWLELSRDSLLEPAFKLRQAINQACSSTRLGLMSSLPDVHSAEGRDWHMLQQALGDEKAFLTRPHLPPYTETTAIECPPSVTRQTIANLKRPIEIYPELENSPRNGQYSKSAKYSLWQCFNAAVYGSHGITINHFDMMGSGISLDENFGPAMKKAKPQLNALVNLGIDDVNSQGVNVLFSPEISTFSHCDDTSSFSGLYQDSTVWSKTLYTLGISHSFTQGIIESPNPYAISGQTLRCYDDKSIKKLLSGSVILDAASIEVLLEKGYGKLIGINQACWQELEKVGYAYEQILENDPSVYGLANPRMTSQRCGARLLAMKPDSNAIVRAIICRHDHKALFPAAITFCNSLGGQILALSYPFDSKQEFFMSFCNVFRRKMLQNLIFEIAPNAKLAVIENHPAHLYRVQTKKGLLLAAFNIIMDDAQHIIIRTQQNQLNPDKLFILNKNGKWDNIQPELLSDDNPEKIKIKKTLKPLEGLFVLLVHNEVKL